MTSTLSLWLARPCACVHPDAHECAVIRMAREHARPDPGCYLPRVRIDPDERCECACHELDRDEETDRGID